MSKPKRYRGLTYEEKMFGGAKPPFPADLMIDPEGNLVEYSDYAALAADNERLGFIIQSITKAHPLINEAVASAMIAYKEIGGRK